jgi:CRP/FNR family cyclic AMP-dependent transcriptional regulator
MLTLQFEIALGFAAIGALLMVTSNLMRRMIPLRAFAIGANAFFIIQFAIERNWILIALQVTLLSINGWRLWTIRKLLHSLESAKEVPPLRDWLLPQMKKRTFKAGTTLFLRGDPANELFYIQSGTIRLPDLGVSLGAGNVIGEIGVFSAEHQRTATVVCETDMVAYSMTDEAAYVLFVSNPQIGLYLVRLIIEQMRGQIELSLSLVAQAKQQTEVLPSPAS